MRFAEEKAIVSHIDGECVFLATQNNVSCDNCSSKSGCGQVLSIFTFKSKSTLKVNNTLNLKKGDEVIVRMPSELLLKATILMYLVPLLLLFIIALVAKLMFGESASIVGGISGLFMGLLIVNKYSQQKAKTEEFRPAIIRKIINLELV